MANKKPLPALPTSTELTALSVEARNHRARLIRHFLTDIHEPGLENRRDGWTHVFEEALDDLSQHLSRGNWLGSIKRGKELKRRLGKEKAANEPSQEDTKALGSGKGNKEGLGQQERVTVSKNDDKPLPSQPETSASPLKQLRTLVARPAPRPDEPRSGHLVLCLAPHGSRIPLPTEDSGFDFIPANIGCTFSPGSFSLQVPGEDEVGTILYGLDGLETNALNTNLRLVGGTFTFKGVNSPLQHHLLFKVLKLAIYVHLSSVLEQHLLSDSGIQLRFSRPKLLVPSPSTPSAEWPSKEPKEVRTKSRNSIIPSSFTNFFLKRNLSYRGSQTIHSPGGRSGSLDLTTIPPSSDHEEEPTPRKSTEGANGVVSGLGLRRFSFMGDRRPSLRKSSLSSQDKKEPTSQPFVMALKRIEESKGLLSTSAGVTLGLPKLIVELAEKEKTRADQPEGQNLSRRLRGDERVALTSLLGWDGKDAEGRGMTGILGFVRQQEISVLCSLHVPSSSSTTTIAPPLPVASTSSSSTAESSANSSMFTDTATTTTSTTTTASNLTVPGLSPCGKPHWVTYQYFSSNSVDDQMLGDWIVDFAKGRNVLCDRPGCPFTQGQHERRIIHDGVRVIVKTAEDRQVDPEDKEDPKAEDDDIQIWESCAVCNAKTQRTTMSDGTSLFSFAKYLELLIYSPALCTLTPALCEHTTPPPGPLTALPLSRLNVIRHFSTASADVYFALSTIEDIFELRVPRLHLIRGLEKATPPSTTSKHAGGADEPSEKTVLRKEIKKWWEGVTDHIDRIEKVLNSAEVAQKSLPRLPSLDDAYHDFESSIASGSRTPTASSPFPLPPLPPTTPSSPSKEAPQNDSYFTIASNISTDTQSSKTPTVPPKDNPEQRLAALRHNFQWIEQSLYAQLAKTPESSLNNVRRSFIATGKGTRNRLKAWQAKHLGAAKSKIVGELVAEEPEWWGKGCHVAPTGNIIVREHDWGSIIAHTLSTSDYQLEMANLSMVRSGSQSTTAPLTPSAPSESAPTSSFFSVATGYRLFSSSKNQPDPDQEDVVWNEPEHYSAVISRKEHTRDPTSLLSIRKVLHQKTVPEQSNGSISGSKFAASSTLTPVQAASGASASVKAKANVALSMEAAGGYLNVPEVDESVGMLLQELESDGIPTTSRPASISSEVVSHSSSGFVDAHIRRGKASSIISAESGDSQATIGKDDEATPGAPQPSSLPPPVPPKGEPPESSEKENVDAGAAGPPATTGEAPPATSSGFASALAIGINSAMRYVLNSETASRTMPPIPPPSSANRHHGLLLADISNIDERPHIKYDWTVGKRIKFSCTVYYAKQFDILRKKCGISDIFLKSLSKSTNWAAEGGKSKSNFWKTSDDRFIIKTLVNAWNVADLQVLVEHAPSYFRYMDATANKPTVVAKLLGFYTIEIRNLETGNVQSKADLLVMENLFFGQNISKTFDLKGIQGRKVKTQGHATKTLFDGEWIEGQQRTLTLVRPYSKAILRDAIRSDAEFLAKSNIMDYSLLLGVDEEKKEIACGLVDTIGSFTFAKTLEYKAKQGLQSSTGKEVTVMPPAEYQERFVNALEGYFVACPDKWSKPLDESKIISDPNLLPSIL